MSAIEERNTENKNLLESIQHSIIHNKHMVPQAKSMAALILFKKQNDLDTTDDEESYFEEIVSFLSIQQ